MPRIVQAATPPLTASPSLLMGNQRRELSYTPCLLLKSAPHLWKHPPTNPRLFSYRFKCPCPIRRQWHFRGDADSAYNTLHFASKVVCQKGRCPLWIPPQQNGAMPHDRSIAPFVVSSPFHGLRVVPCKLTLVTL